MVCRILSLPKSVFWSTQTKAAQNKAAKSALKTDLKKFEAAVAEGNRSEADVAYKVAVKAVDKAAAKGLLHKNNAANKKSSHDHQAEQAGLSSALCLHHKSRLLCRRLFSIFPYSTPLDTRGGAS